MKFRKEIEFKPLRLIVDAGVRYWEDATVNGVTDEDGTLIPFRHGLRWKPIIALEPGRVIDWPVGMEADIYYKVCDDGHYWLEDFDGKRLKSNRHYVPNDLLSIGKNGYGDYIIMKIGGDGLIKGWNMPELDGEEWEEVKP